MVALYSTANHAYYMREVLARSGIDTKVVSIPGYISKGSCSTALDFDSRHLAAVVRMSGNNRCPVQQLYKVEYGRYIPV